MSQADADRPAIELSGLAKMFGSTKALAGIDLEVPRGVVFGYLGPNGAGKTTTIRVLMGLLKPTSGSARILGLDALTERDLVHRHVGYLPGEFVAYPDLSGEQYLRYIASLRSGVDGHDVELLAKRLDVDLTTHIGSLSHGNRQKIGLIQAFMHQPAVLILDEPTIGLDPLMQREFISMVKEARDGGATVFLSSHILDEVEAVADTVGILREGRLLAVEHVDALKAKASRQLQLVFSATPTDLRSIPGVAGVHVEGNTALLRVDGSMEDLLKRAAPFGIRNIVSREVDLEDIFLHYYERAQ